jgi:hypothetical protein
MTQSSSSFDPVSPSAAIVTCVEAGYLETQTIRMIESLRRWGGRMAGVPVVAVTPRLGPPIAASTRRKYDELGVTYLRTKATSKYAWYNFMNKPAALLAAENAVKVDSMIWLDADILIVGEPWDLLLGLHEDFAGCPTEKNIATTGPDDPYHPYWMALCDAVGLSIDDVPWVHEFRDQTKIRAYFNGGVISYRPASGYGQAYLEATERILDAKIQLKDDGIFYHEQAAVGLAMAKHKVRWRVLSESCNYHFGSSTRQHVDPEKFRNAKVLHYHRSMQADRWQQFLTCFESDYPKVLEWLRPFGPLADNLPMWKRAMNKAIRDRRKKMTDSYRTLCRVVS